MAKQQGQGRAFPKNLHPLDSIFWKNLALLASKSLKYHFLFFSFFFWNKYSKICFLRRYIGRVNLNL